MFSEADNGQELSVAFTSSKAGAIIAVRFHCNNHFYLPR